MKRTRILLLLMLLWPGLAQAHPHVYADYEVAITATPSGAHLHFAVNFDAMFKTVIQMESTVDGKKGASSTRQVQSSGAAALPFSPLYLYVTGGEPRVMNLKGAGDQYTFDTDITGTEFSFKVYDPTYYIDVTLNNDKPIMSPRGWRCERRRVNIVITLWGQQQADEVSCVQFK